MNNSIDKYQDMLSNVIIPCFNFYITPHETDKNFKNNETQHYNEKKKKKKNLKTGNSFALLVALFLLVIRQ